MSQNGVNKVILLGRAGQRPEVKFTSGGKPVANFSVAINESFKNGDGEKQERVQWVRCVAWQRLAEICGEYIDKGRELFIEGRLQTRKYTDRNQEERTVTEVVVSQLRLVGGARQGNGSGPAQPDAAGPSTRKTEDAEDCPF